MSTIEFEIGDILSVTTGHLLSRRHMDGIYDILNFMSGDNLFTHQLPRVCREATPVILRQHPQLAAVGEAEVQGITPENLEERLAVFERQFGKKLALSPMSEDEHESIDPRSELAEKMHPSKIIEVNPRSLR